MGVPSVEVDDGLLGVGELISRLPCRIVLAAPPDKVFEAFAPAVEARVEYFLDFPFEIFVDFDGGWGRCVAGWEGVGVVGLEQ